MLIDIVRLIKHFVTKLTFR